MSSNLSNIQTFQMVIIYAIYIFLIVSVICTIIMLVSIFRQGDERRKYILSRTCTHTFLICTGILFLDVIYTVFFERYTHFTVQNMPVFYLGIVAIVFTISLFVNKRKHGN
ncbi:hypothetical protein A7X67_10595 [Clostridium sp. W14A]|nr:hypothetical protein A7X67_10595 [Clostridium sp. W14A]